MGMWNGPVNDHVAADLFVRAVLSKANALHLEFAAMFETRNLKVKPQIGQFLLLMRKLSINSSFATFL